MRTKSRSGSNCIQSSFQFLARLICYCSLLEVLKQMYKLNKRYKEVERGNDWVIRFKCHMSDIRWILEIRWSLLSLSITLSVPSPSLYRRLSTYQATWVIHTLPPQHPRYSIGSRLRRIHWIEREDSKIIIISNHNHNQLHYHSDLYHQLPHSYLIISSVTNIQTCLLRWRWSESTR
jgi:hypothetical protein